MFYMLAAQRWHQGLWAEDVQPSNNIIDVKEGGKIRLMKLKTEKQGCSMLSELTPEKPNELFIPQIIGLNYIE